MSTLWGAPIGSGMGQQDDASDSTKVVVVKPSKNVDFTSGFVSIDDINKANKGSSSSVLSDAKKYQPSKKLIDAAPTGDMWYDLGRMYGDYHYSPQGEAFRDKVGKRLKKAVTPSQKIKDLYSRLTNPAGAKRTFNKMKDKIGGDIKKISGGIKSAQDYIEYADALARGRVERRKFNKKHEKRIQDMRDENKEVESRAFNRAHEKRIQQLRDDARALHIKTMKKQGKLTGIKEVDDATAKRGKEEYLARRRANMYHDKEAGMYIPMSDAPLPNVPYPVVSDDAEFDFPIGNIEDSPFEDFSGEWTPPPKPKVGSFHYGSPYTKSSTNILNDLKKAFGY